MNLIEEIDRFALDVDWTETLESTSKMNPVEDVNDDLKREAIFLQLALENTIIIRNKMKSAGLKFTRPDDFFAEMLKTDSHMEKIRQKLLDEEEGLKLSAEAKKQRHLKKFGKQVQQEKLIERQKQKSETLDKIKIARKKKDSGVGNDEFDVEAIDSIGEKRKRREPNGKNEMKRSRPDDKKGDFKRTSKDQKYGFGGKKKFAKSNTSKSTDDLSGFSVKKMKGGKLGNKSTKSRPNNSKRAFKNKKNSN